MIVRELQSDADLLAAQKIGVLAFNTSCDMEETAKNIAANAKPQGIYGAFDEGGRLCAKLKHCPYNMIFDGHRVKMSGVAGVASLVEARGKGAVRAIFRHLLLQQRQDGWLFSTLYPFANSYYRQFGYDVCNFNEVYTLPTKALAAYAKSSRCEATLGLPDDDRTPYELIFAEFTRGRNLSVCRTDDMWSRRLSPDPFKDKVYRYLLRDAQQCPVAYVIFTPGSVDGSRSIKVTDSAFVDAGAGRDLLGFLATLSAQYPKLEISLPTDVDLVVALPEAYDCRKSWGACGQGRVLDVQAVLELMRYPAENGSFSIAVDDVFLPEVSGTFRVVQVRTTIEVSASRELSRDPNRTLIVRSLSRACSRMEQILPTLENTKDENALAEFKEVELEFHATLIKSNDNAILTHIYDYLAPQLYSAMERLSETFKEQQKKVNEYRYLVDALDNGQTDLAVALTLVNLTNISEKFEALDF